MKAYRGYGSPHRDSVNDLDCTECGGWFPTFTALAEHVKKIHTKPESSGMWPSRASHYKEENREQEEREKNMPQLPRSNRPAAHKSKSARQAGRIPGATNTQSNDYNPFLNAAVIGGFGAKAKLTLTGNARMTDGQFGEQIVAEVRFGRATYDWGIKLNTPNHRWLEDNLGLNTARWKNKIVPVEIKENMGRDYIAIARGSDRSSAPARKPARKAKRARR